MVFTSATGADLDNAYWVPDEKSGWLLCRIKARLGDSVTFVSREGCEVHRPVHVLSTLHTVGRNELDGVDDICALDSVCEGAVLHTLRHRYQEDRIYTRVSRGILIAINPFKVLPDLYSKRVQTAYRDAADCGSLPPHIFGIAQDALQQLRLPDAKSQAILVSGESGAGKTESTKHILSYALGRADGGPGSMEEKILGTNPILEAFGNAATTRNRNSSRFAKWLDLRLSYSGGSLQAHGCTLMHYLLETARVCKHAPGESGYHIFYLLLQAPAALLEELGLVGDPAAYSYLAGGQCGPEPAGGLEAVQEALGALGVDGGLQRELFRALAGVLLLGNCEFEGSRLSEGSVEVVQRAARLLGLDRQELADCMLVATRRIAGEVMRTCRRPEEARAVRDGLARLIYDSLFEWLMQRMNHALMPPSASRPAGAAPCRSFSVLDIAGFENFKTNSLEQLLINLSNEYLQQLFNDSVFKAEIRDCEAEGITLVSTLSFCDNLDCLELLDGTAGLTREREPGILDLLDEAVALPRATDAAFAAKVAAKFAERARGTGHARLIAPRFGGHASFTVKHFAGDITYSCDGWIEKNADRPPPGAVGLLTGSQLGFARQLGAALERKEAGTSQGRGKAWASGGQSASRPFRTSLRSLMGRLAKSELHFVRCIKPREQEEEGRFLPRKVAEQLRSSGILEAVRIRQCGYSSRWTFTEFVARFNCITASTALAQPMPRDAAEVLISALHDAGGPGPDARHLITGRTKVFATASAAATIEARRARAMEDSVLLMQRMSHVLLSRRRVAAARAERLQLEQMKASAAAATALATGPLQGDGGLSRCTESPAFIDADAGRAAAATDEPISAAASSSTSAVPCREGTVATPLLEEALAPDVKRGEDAQLFDELRMLEAAVQSRDEEQLMHALEGVDTVRLAERLLTAARRTLAPMQHARNSLDSAVRSATEKASDANIDALRTAIDEGEAAGLAANRLAAAKEALREAQRAATQTTLQHVSVALESAMKSAASNATDTSIKALQVAIDHGMATGLDGYQLDGARETLRGAQKAAALAALQRASKALDDAVKSVAKHATDANIQGLRRAIDRATAAGLDEDRLAAAREGLAEAQRAAALAALHRARELLDGVIRSAGAGRGTPQSMDTNIEALQRAIDQGAAAGLPADQLDTAREAMGEARRVPALAALQRACGALDAAVRNDAPNLNIKIEVLRRAIDRGVAASLSEEELATAREAMKEAPRAAALAALHQALEALDPTARGVAQRMDGNIEALQRAIDRSIAAGIAEDQLDAAKAAMRDAAAQMQKAAALVNLQRAREALDGAVRSADQNVFANIAALRGAIDRGAAAGLSDDQLAGAREAMREAQMATALTVLQQAHEALDSAVGSADQSVDVHIEVLRRAIDEGAAAGLGEVQLAAAREAAREAPRAVALAALQRAHEALDAAVRHEAHVDTNIGLLREAINRGGAAGLSEHQLAPAREAMREAPRAAALVAIQHACEALDSAVRGGDHGVDAMIEQLQRAVDQGAATGLADDQLAAARNAMQEAPREAASAALKHAYDALHNDMLENMDRLQGAIDRRVAVGNAPTGQLTAARETLKEMRALAALASVHRARETLHSAPRRAASLLGLGAASLHADTAALHMNMTMLQSAISHAEEAGVTEDQLAPAREESSRAAREQALDSLSIAVTMTTHCASDRNISMLQHAINHAAAMAAGEQVAAARETLRAAQRMANLQPLDECSICFEQEVTSVMPCCGREGSGMRICSECLARHAEQRRAPCCPFCRAPL